MDFNISNNNKHELELIYDNIAKGIRTRTKCYQSEQGQKSIKNFSKFRKILRYLKEF